MRYVLFSARGRPFSAWGGVQLITQKWTINTDDTTQQGRTGDIWIKKGHRLERIILCCIHGSVSSKYSYMRKPTVKVAQNKTRLWPHAIWWSLFSERGHLAKGLYYAFTRTILRGDFFVNYTSYFILLFIFSFGSVFGLNSTRLRVRSLSSDDVHS